MINASELLNIVSQGKPKDLVNIGIVIAKDGYKCKVRFDGEVKESNIFYKCLMSYSPQIEDTVILIRAKGTYIVIGKIER